MREGWTERRLGNICDFRAGEYIPKERYDDGPYFIYGSNSVMGRVSTPLIAHPHVVMAAVGANAGAVRFSPEPSWVNNNAFALIAQPGVEPQFLYFWLEARLRKASILAGTGQPYVKKGLLREQKVALPPLDEQRRIVDLIGSLDAVVERAAAVAAGASTTLRRMVDELFRSIRHAAPSAPLGSIAETVLGKMKWAGGEDAAARYPYLRNQDVQWDSLNLEGLAEMPFSDRDRERLSLRAGDVLICEGGEVGRAAVVDEDLGDIFFQKAVHRVRVTDVLVPRFVLYFFIHMAQSGQLASYTSQSTIAHLTGEKLRTIPVPIVALDEQASHVARFDSLRSTARAADALVERLRVMRRRALNDLLSGSHGIPAKYDLLLRSV